MDLTQDQKIERVNYLETISTMGGVPILLDRYSPETGFSTSRYGIPENRVSKGPREFQLNPISVKSMEKFISIMKGIWPDRVVAILTGGTRVDRNARSGGYISPHSIYYGIQDAKKWCTGIDIDGIIWRSNPELTIYTADRSLAPREFGTYVPNQPYSTGDGEINGLLESQQLISIEAGYNKPYVVMACALAQCFGTVLHDKCSGRTGVTHRDHFHVDNVRPIGYRSWNSQETLIQMALNLYGFELKIDGIIGRHSGEAMNQWRKKKDIEFVSFTELFPLLMEAVPLDHGKVQ